MVDTRFAVGDVVEIVGSELHTQSARDIHSGSKGIISRILVWQINGVPLDYLTYKVVLEDGLVRTFSGRQLRHI